MMLKSVCVSLFLALADNLTSVVIMQAFLDNLTTLAILDSLSSADFFLQN